MVKAALSTWGRLSAPEHEVVPLTRRSDVARVLATSMLPGIAYGNGRCYGDESLNSGRTAWTTRGLDRFIAFEPETGIVRCEAGVLLDELTRIVLPQGWFLPVTPGTAFATVGGCVANDVHGKNHHRCGTFGEHVRALRLVRTDGTTIDCTREDNADWLVATIGGMGLTGIVTEVELQLRRAAGPWIDTWTAPFESLDAFFAASRAHGAMWEYTVAWIDTTHRSGVRGLLFCGNHASRTDAARPMPTISAARVPAWRWMNRRSTAAFNALYYARARRRHGSARVDYRSFFYPLDSIAAWNRLYGRDGFYQYQCVVPVTRQLEVIGAILEAVIAAGSASFVSVLKTFAPRPPAGLMSFPMEGTTLSLDFANRGDATRALLSRLDALVADAGGRLYAAKDATMTAAAFRRGYPNLDAFLRFRDPGIDSDMARRLLDA